MAWESNNYGNRSYGQYSGRGRSYGNSNRPAYNSNYNGANRSNYGGQPKKHSGCTSGMGKNGKKYVRGWKFTKGAGLTSFFAAPYHGTREKKSASGRVWENWMLKIVNQKTMQENHFPVLYDTMTGKVIIQRLGFVMNPKGGRGGYVGTFTQR